MKKVRKLVDKLEENALAEKVSKSKGVFGYTPLHEAVASGKPDVLDYILKRTNSAHVNSKENSAHVNCKANNDYTPLHLAASSGHEECVRILLRHGADISVLDSFGKTPKQTAEISCKGNIVRLLRSEGETIISESLCFVVCVCVGGGGGGVYSSQAAERWATHNKSLHEYSVYKLFVSRPILNIFSCGLYLHIVFFTSWFPVHSGHIQCM